MRIPVLFVTLLFALTAYADSVKLNETAPDSYTVVKGDTLWGISARFLKDPWKWPEVWQLNKDQIRNPHLIYPGDVVHLVRGPQPRLTLEHGLKTVKLSPQVYSEPIPQSGIPSIPIKAIAPLLNRGGVVTKDELAHAPRLLGTSDERIMFGTNDLVYATAGQSPNGKWEIVRVGPALVDPRTGDVLGHQLIYVGEAQTVQPGSPQLLRITSTDQEALEQDRLIPLPENATLNIPPHAPDKPINGMVMASLSGVEGAGPYTTVLLNKGRADGMEVGDVLGVFKAGRSMADPGCRRARLLAFMAGDRDAKAVDCVRGEENATTLPERRIGLVFVYRVFDRVSYALIMSSVEPVYVRDDVKNP